MGYLVESVVEESISEEEIRLSPEGRERGGPGREPRQPAQHAQRP